MTDRLSNTTLRLYATAPLEPGMVALGNPEARAMAVELERWRALATACAEGEAAMTPDPLADATLRDILTLGTIHKGHGDDAARAMAGECLASRAFMDRFLWTYGMHICSGAADCLVCEAARLRGEETR
jgi:hypothetical protein